MRKPLETGFGLRGVSWGSRNIENLGKPRLKSIKSNLRHFIKQVLATAKVSVHGCGRDSHARSQLIDREPFDIRADQCGLNQGLLQVAVVEASFKWSCTPG